MREPISFIVIAHHNSQTLSSCMDSVEADSSTHDELILVLNNPDAQTKSLSLNRPRWIVVDEPTQGAQFARNFGANLAKNKILAFLDGEIRITRGWTEVMLKNFDDPWVAVGQSRIQQMKEKSLFNWIKRYQYLKFNTRFYFPAGVSRIPILLGLDSAAMMMRKEWFLRVGGFDKVFPRLEDSDITLRIMYQGGDIFYDDRTLAEEINDSEESIFYWVRKQYRSYKLMPLFIAKHNIDFNFPFAVAPVAPIPRIGRNWELFFRLIELVGFANSPHLLKATATHYYSFKPNLKKNAIMGITNPNLRTVWVRGNKREFDLFFREFLRPQE
jgi:glycosyltransferase involved in cell wall biosynthesis